MSEPAKIRCSLCKKKFSTEGALAHHARDVHKKRAREAKPVLIAPPQDDDDDDGMVSLFAAQRAAENAEKAKRLAEADVTGWKQNTLFHFTRVVDGTRIDWWPSTAKAMVDGRMFYGGERVRQAFQRLGLFTGAAS